MSFSQRMVRLLVLLVVLACGTVLFLAAVQADWWRAANFTLGLAIGAAGSALAVFGRSERARNLGTAGALMGIAFVVAGFVAAWFLKKAAMSLGLSMLPLLAPMPAAFASLVYLVEACRPAKRPPASFANLTEEPRLPLSRL